MNNTGRMIHPVWRQLWRYSGWLFFGSWLWFLAGCNPPPTVDLPAANLSVKITVIDTDANPSDNKVPIVVQFFQTGTFVRLSSADVACNGVALAWNGLGYAERVPMVAVGGVYHCTHTRAGVTTSVDVTVPPRPVILSPASGAAVNRSANLTITYAPDGGTGMRASAGDGSTGLGGNVQADSGTYSGYDVSSLKAGPGTIGLTREFTFTPSGTGFASAEIAYSSGSDIAVTWN